MVVITINRLTSIRSSYLIVQRGTYQLYHMKLSPAVVRPASFIVHAGMHKIDEHVNQVDHSLAIYTRVLKPLLRDPYTTSSQSCTSRRIILNQCLTAVFVLRVLQSRDMDTRTPSTQCQGSFGMDDLPATSDVHQVVWYFIVSLILPRNPTQVCQVL